MRIATNWPSLVAGRSLWRADGRLGKTIAHLSSGQRVMTAADDTAAVGIANRLMGQFKGLNQANRNAADGLSLVQTAEGALTEISSLLHRGRELSVQASNSTLTAADRKVVQEEIDQIMAEIDRISDMTTFNGKRLLNQSGNAAALGATLNGLRNGWLEQAEKVINTKLGLFGDNSTLGIQLDDSGGDAVWVTGSSSGGPLTNVILHVNLQKFGALVSPSGGAGPIYNDRQVARGLTWAMMARTGDYENSPGWFTSGVMDYVAGGTELLAQAVNIYGAAAVANAAKSLTLSTAMPTDDLGRAAAYLATRYLDQWIKVDQGIAGGIKSLMNTIQNVTPNPNDALFQLTMASDLASFLSADVNANIDGYLTGLMPTLTGPDVGSVNTGTDADSVIPNGGTFSLSPMTGFTANWLLNPGTSIPTQFDIQVGPNEGQTLGIRLTDITSYTLNLLGTDVINKSQEAIQRFETAVNIVASARNYLGTSANRLEHIATSNQNLSINEQDGYSKQIDLDFAKAMTDMVRQQIMQASATATLAQANARPRAVIRLLQGVA